MTLVELKYILAVSQEKHFGRAAARAHVSQPTLSVAINKLEKEIGVKIFERQTGSVRVTEVGERLVEQAYRVLEEVDLFKDVAMGSKNHLDSPLKIGAIPTIAPYLFPTLIPRLKKIAPKMPLIINEDVTDNLHGKLHRGELDVIILALPYKESGVLVKKLYEEPFVVLMPKTHPLAKEVAVTCRELKNENVLLLGEGHCFREHVLEMCPECYNPQEMQQAIEGASLETLRHMVASGMGITILPCTATRVKEYSKTLCVKPFKSKTPKRTIVLCWRSSLPRTKAIDAILKALSQSKIADVCPIGG